MQLVAEFILRLREGPSLGCVLDLHEALDCWFNSLIILASHTLLQKEHFVWGHCLYKQFD